jgi:hypothetical protein
VQREKGRRRRNDTAAYLPWRVRRVYQLNNLWGELEQAEMLLFVRYRERHAALILLCGHHGALQGVQRLHRVVRVRDVDAMTMFVCGHCGVFANVQLGLSRPGTIGRLDARHTFVPELYQKYPPLRQSTGDPLPFTVAPVTLGHIALSLLPALGRSRMAAFLVPPPTGSMGLVVVWTRDAPSLSHGVLTRRQHRPLTALTAALCGCRTNSCRL